MPLNSKNQNLITSEAYPIYQFDKDKRPNGSSATSSINGKCGPGQMIQFNLSTIPLIIS